MNEQAPCKTVVNGQRRIRTVAQSVLFCTLGVKIEIELIHSSRAGNDEAGIVSSGCINSSPFGFSIIAIANL